MRGESSTNGCSALATEILGYMVRNPDAYDTLEGIVEWWLLEYRIRRQTTRVREALDELVARGYLVPVESGGRTRFRINPARLGEIRHLFDDDESRGAEG